MSFHATRNFCPQVHRLQRGPGPDYVWQVLPFRDTLGFVAKLLELHDVYTQKQWEHMDKEQRRKACGDSHQALRESPPEDLALVPHLGGEAWQALMEWMEAKEMIPTGLKSGSRRNAAAAVCHRQVGDKRVAMWILRFGTHQNAVKFFEKQRIDAVENPQASHSVRHGSKRAAGMAEGDPKQARVARGQVRMAEVMRWKMNLADCPEGWCSCGRKGSQFECAHCGAQYCRQHCQVLEQGTGTSAHSPGAKAKVTRYLVCVHCRKAGMPLTLEVKAKLPRHSKPPHCEAYVAFARHCVHKPVWPCQYCNRWLCHQCSGKGAVCAVCPATISHHPVELQAPNSSTWSSMPPQMQQYLRMSDTEFKAAMARADEATEKAGTGGRLLSGGGFQSIARTGRGVVFAASARDARG